MLMIKLSKILILLLFSLFLSCTSMNTLKPTRQRLQEFHISRLPVSEQLDIDFLLYFPKDYNPDKKWPLLIFLHGRGERGDDLERVKIHGPTKLIKAGQDFPFIIAAPQCPDTTRWVITKLDRWLSYLLTRLPVDEKRIYLTGLSMGGFGTWIWAGDRPDRFAAIAPVCGGGEVKRAEMLKDIPIWVFHGAKDSTVPVSRSQVMVDALKELGADVRFTIYPEANHDSWTETYNNPELYSWFLEHHK